MIRWFRQLKQGEQVTLLAGIPAALIAGVIALVAAVIHSGSPAANAAPAPTTSSVPFMAPTTSPADLPSSEPTDESPSDDPVTDEPSTDPATADQAVSYTTVDLLPLCDETDCSGSQPVGGSVFQFTDQALSGDYPHFDNTQAFGQGRNTCKYMDVQFAADREAQEEGHPTIDYLTFKQSSKPTISASVKVGKVNRVRVPLDGGPLWIAASTESGPAIHTNYVPLKITGSCSTPNGLPN